MRLAIKGRKAAPPRERRPIGIDRDHQDLRPDPLVVQPHQRGPAQPPFRAGRTDRAEPLWAAQNTDRRQVHQGPPWRWKSFGFRCGWRSRDVKPPRPANVVRSELIVITKTYDLILWSCNHTSEVPRNHRFVLGERIERNLYGLRKTLIAAKYTKDRPGAGSPSVSDAVGDQGT